MLGLTGSSRKLPLLPFTHRNGRNFYVCLLFSHFTCHPLLYFQPACCSFRAIVDSILFAYVNLLFVVSLLFSVLSVQPNEQLEIIRQHLVRFCFFFSLQIPEHGRLNISTFPFLFRMTDDCQCRCDWSIAGLMWSKQDSRQCSSKGPQCQNRLAKKSNLLVLSKGFYVFLLIYFVVFF